MDAAEVLAQLRSDTGLREMARALLLGDELLQLPEALAKLTESHVELHRLVASLAEGQARLVEGQGKLEESVARLVEGQAKLFEGQAKLEESVARLVDRQGALEESVARLVEGQARLFEGQAALEHAVARLFDGQAALEESVARLVEGQARLFDGQAALEHAVARLFDGQAALERRVGRLEEGQEALRREVGSLSRTIGGTAEEDAVNMVEYVMGLRGYRLLGEPTTLDLDGDGELDVAVRVEDAAGRQLSVLVEAKVRLRAREVRRWAERVSDPDFQRYLAAAGLPGPYLVYGYGIRVYPDAKEAARSLGIGVISSRGEDVSTEPRAA